MTQKKQRETLFGFNTVFETVRAARRKVFKVLVASKSGKGRIEKILELAARRGLTIEHVTRDALESVTGAEQHQGVAAIVSPFPLLRPGSLLKRYENKNRSGFILIADNLEDPHNFGALIRTACCVGVDCVVVAKDRSVSPVPSVSRVSAGTMEHSEICVVTNIAAFIREVKKRHFWITGLDASGNTALFDADFQGRVALVIGGEYKGIRPVVRRECDFLVSIPMTEKVNSLNAAAAGAIAMYEVFRQRRGI